MKSLLADIGRGPAALDTNVFIYFLEEHPQWLRLVAPIFEACDRGALRLVTSALTLMELAVPPFRAGNAALVGAYERFLTQSRGLSLLPIERPLLLAAAHLRAVSPLRTPDALQLAAAFSASCTCFVTNDRRIPQIPGLRILRLYDYLESTP